MTSFIRENWTRTGRITHLIITDNFIKINIYYWNRRLNNTWLSLTMFIEKFVIFKKKKSKLQPRMSNPETQATLSPRHRTKTNKTKTQHRRDEQYGRHPKNCWWSHVNPEVDNVYVRLMLRVVSNISAAFMARRGQVYKH